MNNFRFLLFIYFYLFIFFFIYLFFNCFFISFLLLFYLYLFDDFPILYNVPPFASVTIPVDLVCELGNHKNIIGRPLLYFIFLYLLFKIHLLICFIYFILFRSERYDWQYSTDFRNSKKGKQRFCCNGWFCRVLPSGTLVFYFLPLSPLFFFFFFLFFFAVFFLLVFFLYNKNYRVA